jgi:hypothetical protein
VLTVGIENKRKQAENDIFTMTGPNRSSHCEIDAKSKEGNP